MSTKGCEEVLMASSESVMAQSIEHRRSNSETMSLFPSQGSPFLLQMTPKQREMTADSGLTI